MPEGGTLAVYGLGPVGQLCTRIALQRRIGRVIGVDLVPERLEMARRWGVEALDDRDHDDVAAVIRDLTGGRGPDAVIDAVGMEAHGSVLSEAAQATKLQVDRLEALRKSIGTVRRGGTLSVSGVYAGLANLFPLGDLFDRQIQVRMGQRNVRRWTDDILPLLIDEADPLGAGDLTTHRLPLDEAPGAYELFQKKEDGCIKVVLRPS